MAGLLALHWFLAFTSQLNKSPAYDEPAHATAGCSYWRFNDYRLHPENGNLPQRWMTLPLAVQASIRFPTRDQAAWQESDVWTLGDQFFHESGNDLPRLLMWGRGFAALLGVGVCLLVYFWSKSLFGEAGGLVSLALCALCPTMLAHSPLMSSDMCAALFFAGSAWSIWWVLERVSLLRVAVSGALAAGLFLSKTSAVLIVPMALAMAVCHFLLRRRLLIELPGRAVEVRSAGRWLLAIATLVAVYATVIWVLLWTAYGWRYSAAQPQQSPFKDLYKHGTLKASCDQAGAAGRVILALGQRRVLPEAWLYGASYVFGHRHRKAFLNGEYSLYGWWYFFPYCVLVKTPLPLFGLLLASAAAGYYQRRQAGPQRASLAEFLAPSIPLWTLMAVYWLVAMTSTLNIGHRHMLPVYPPMFILAGGSAFWLGRRSRAAGIVVGLLLAAFAVESVRAYPHYLAYFNQCVDRRQAYRHLVDSSLDWGQDLPGLKQWLDEHGLSSGDHPPVYLAYFGIEKPHAYGIDAIWLPVDGGQMQLEPLRPGVYCISATTVQSVYAMNSGRWTQDYERRYRESAREMLRYEQLGIDKFNELLGRQDPRLRETIETFESLRAARLMAFLRQREPDDQVGYSILIYHLTKDDLKQALLGPVAEMEIPR